MGNCLAGWVYVLVAKIDSFFHEHYLVAFAINLFLLKKKHILKMPVVVCSISFLNYCKEIWKEKMSSKRPNEFYYIIIRFKNF